MAKKRKRTTSTAIVRAVPIRTPAPIIRVQAPRAPVAKKRHHRRRGGGSSGAFNPASMQSHAVGGFLYGIVEKNFGAVIPTLPIIGRAGSIAIACYLFGGRGAHGVVGEVGKAAAVIAGYQFGTTGQVAGFMAPKIAGVAAQV